MRALLHVRQVLRRGAEARHRGGRRLPAPLGLHRRQLLGRAEVGRRRHRARVDARLVARVAHVRAALLPQARQRSHRARPRQHVVRRLRRRPVVAGAAAALAGQGDAAAAGLGLGLGLVAVRLRGGRERRLLHGLVVVGHAVLGLVGGHGRRLEARLRANADLEVGVLQRLHRGGPLDGVPLAHGRHEVDCLGRRVGDQLAQRRGLEAGEAEVHVLRQPDPLRPALRRGRAHHGADLVDLVRLAAAGEERAQRVELRHDRAHRKHVDRRVVVRRAQEHLRRAVPARGDVVGVGRLGADLARQPKVRDLHRVLGHQQVLRLHVAVEVAVLVDVRQALHDLVQPVAYARLGQQLVPVLHHLVHVAIQELKHKVQLVVLADDLLQLHHARVVELAQRLDFPQRHALLP
mmetsp:Transcript_28252/g.71009  ORF Transcript_28252/g.71009 Transcript_28252/m.71009 type:complete len:405 (-) Transcript_28252:437-1651(-)